MTRRALAQKNSDHKRVRRAGLLRSGLIWSASVLSLAAVSLFLVDQMFSPTAFQINQLKISGRFVNLEPKEVEAVILRHKTGNFFSINLTTLRKQVEAMRWVDRASVRREWPNSLTVKVVEHKPIMRLNDNSWVNIRGNVVDLPEYASQTPMIKLVGEADVAKSMMVSALRWSKQLAAHSLLLREVTLSATGSWSLRLRYRDDINQSPDEFELMLGDSDVEARLARFEVLFNRRFRFSRERLVSADTRYPDGVAVTTKAFDEDNKADRKGSVETQLNGGLSLHTNQTLSGISNPRFLMISVTG